MTYRNASSNLPVIPLVSYTNPDIEKVSILENNDKKTGIYRWTNKVTGKFYIGLAINLKIGLKIIIIFLI